MVIKIHHLIPQHPRSRGPACPTACAQLQLNRGVQALPLNPTGPNSANPQCKLRSGKGQPRLHWPGGSYQLYNNLKICFCSCITHCWFWCTTISNSCFIIGLFFYHLNWSVYFTGNYWREIRIMAWTPNPPCSVLEGMRLAWLILLPAIPCPVPILQEQWNNGGFGSTGPE